MTRLEKWLTGVSLDDPVDRVARQALTSRLQAVSRFLDEAIGGADESEAIHQLRIWTRRAAAAIRLFAPAIPRSKQKRIKKWLKNIRRQAGEVRDCDVHLARLETAQQRPPKSIVKALKKQRRRSRRELKALRRRFQRNDRFEQRSTELVESVRWPKRHSSREAPPFGPWFRQQISPSAEVFFSLCSQPVSKDEQLHELRIAGKRLRYALELAGPAMEPSIHHEIYEELSEFQQQLGRVSDHLAAITGFRQWIKETPKKSQRRDLRELLRHEEALLEEARQSFAQCWTPDRCEKLRRCWQAALNSELPNSDLPP
jgi:CHAD domain-containing protein